MNSDKIKKNIVECCRIVIGCVFIFSGFVKAVDPLGSAYKFQDYFEAFGLSYFDPLALPAAFLLSAFEFALGVCLLLGVYRQITSWLVVLFMGFMTVLTLYSAITNPVSDCGCFGDAVILSNWATFFKNIPLLLGAVAILLWNRKFPSVFHYKTYWIVVLYTYLFILGVSLYCYNHLPVLDFRPYKVGAHIPDLMIIPEGAPHDEYETSFIYEKEGVKKEFTLEDYPANDPDWTFVDAQTVLKKKGYQPPIHDFTITTEEGGDITNDILSDPVYTFLLISHKFNQADDSCVDDVNEIFDYARQNNYPFYCLTASTREAVVRWIEEMGAEYPICTTDEITLKTIIRSNPGLMLLKEGTIINKWHCHDLPKGNDLRLPLEESSLGQVPSRHNVLKIMMLAGILVIPLGILFIFSNRYKRKINTKK